MATNEYEDHNYTIFEDETEKSTQNETKQFKAEKQFIVRIRETISMRQLLYNPH